MRCITRNLIIDHASEITKKWTFFFTRTIKCHVKRNLDETTLQRENVDDSGSSYTAFQFIGILFLVELTHINKEIIIYPISYPEKLKIKFNI